MAEHSIIFSDKQMKVRGNVSPTERNNQRVQGATDPQASFLHGNTHVNSSADRQSKLDELQQRQLVKLNECCY